MAKRAAEGSAFTAKYYDKMVNQKVRDLDISTATKKEVWNVYKEGFAEYLNKADDPEL